MLSSAARQDTGDLAYLLMLVRRRTTTTSPSALELYSASLSLVASAMAVEADS